MSVDLRSYRPTNQKAEELSKKWYIPIDRVEKTLNATSNLARRVWDEPRYSRFGYKFRYLSRRHLNTKFFSDTFFSTVISKSGNNSVQIFVNDLRFMFSVCMRSKSEAPYALRAFIDDVGCPEEIITDNAKEEKSKEWKSILREFGVKERQITPYSQWQNFAENAVRTVKFRALRFIEEKGVPLRLWDHLVDYVVNLNNRITHTTYRLGDRTPNEATLGQTPDISHLVDFTFYDHCWYIRPEEYFPGDKRFIGRWLGPAKQVSSDLSMKFLMESGFVTVTSLVQPIDERSPAVIAQIEEFDKEIGEKLKLKVKGKKGLFLDGVEDDNENFLPQMTDESIPDNKPVSISSVSTHPDDYPSQSTSKGMLNAIIENINKCWRNTMMRETLLWILNPLLTTFTYQVKHPLSQRKVGIS